MIRGRGYFQSKNILFLNLVFLMLISGCASTGQDGRPAVLTEISIIDNQVKIVVDGPFAYTTYKSSDPHKVIIEIPNVRLGIDTKAIKKAKKADKTKDARKADEAKSDKTIISDMAEIIEIIPFQVERPLSTRLEILLSYPVVSTLVDQDTALVIKVQEEPSKAKVAEIKMPAEKVEEPVKEEVKWAEVTKPEEKAVIQPGEVKEVKEEGTGAKVRVEDVFSVEKPEEIVIAKPEERHDELEKAHNKYAHLRIIVAVSEKDAEEMFSKIKNGMPFAFLARERALDKLSRKKYGYLGKVSIESLVEPSLIDTISNLRKGEISGVLNLKDGRYAIIQMVDMSYCDKGKKAFRNKDYKTAEENLLRHIEINPDAVKARIMLGQIYEKRGEIDKAEKMYMDAVYYGLNDEKAYVHLGGLYLKLKQYQIPAPNRVCERCHQVSLYPGLKQYQKDFSY